MPLVVLSIRKRDENRVLVHQLSHELAHVVASALNVEKNADTHLASRDIEVRVREIGAMDINTKDIQVDIYANYYNERHQDLERRLREIEETVGGVIRDFFPLGQRPSWHIWIQLAPGAYCATPRDS